MPVRFMRVTAPMDPRIVMGVPLKGVGAMTSCSGPIPAPLPATEVATASRLPGDA
jgi:hypothetical protein